MLRLEPAAPMHAVWWPQAGSLLIVPMLSDNAMDLVQTGEEVDGEKDLLLERVGKTRHVANA